MGGQARRAQKETTAKETRRCVSCSPNARPFRCNVGLSPDKTNKLSWQPPKSHSPTCPTLPHVAGGSPSVPSARRLEDLTKPITASSEAWRERKQEEKYAAVASRSIHRPEKQQSVDVSTVVDRLYKTQRASKAMAMAAQQRQQATAVAGGGGGGGGGGSQMPAWGSPAASQPLPRRAAPTAKAAARRPSAGESGSSPSLRVPAPKQQQQQQKEQQKKEQQKEQPQPQPRVRGRRKVAPTAAAAAVVLEEAEPPEPTTRTVTEDEPAPEPEPEPEPELELELENTGGDAADETAADTSSDGDGDGGGGGGGTITVEVPVGVSAGDTISVELADGREVDIEVPQGLAAGDVRAKMVALCVCVCATFFSQTTIYDALPRQARDEP